MANDKKLIAGITAGNEKSLEILIDRYSEPLCNFVLQITGSKDLSEEVVADVFINLWKIKENLVIQSSLRAYLYRSCRNRALDQLYKEKKFQADGIDSFTQIKSSTSADGDLNLMELNAQIDFLISEMPRQKQQIFRMSRIDGLKYKEIAEVLSISVNTVQNHMVEAVEFMAKRKLNLF